MSDVCSNCPHAVADHDATGCITCTCGTVFEAADPEPAPEPEPTPEPEPEPTPEPEPEPEAPDA
jgi:hypothetical protein